ncbi:hypothetical protein HDU80_005676 [Chytriomyces hyalinus]|nr:hypothetical protein HDU80_005676 [Chytriomyces hyalinus]
MLSAPHSEVKPMTKQDTLLFDSDNYQEWELATCFHLKSKKIGDTLLTTQPEESDMEGRKQWLEMDNQAMGKIVERVLPKYYEHLREATIASKMMDTVKHILASNNANLKFRMCTLFRNLRMEEDRNLVDHVAELEKHRRILTKELIMDQDMVSQVMQSLPKSWETFLQTIRAQKELHEKYMEFKGLLVAEYEYRCMDNQGKSNTFISQDSIFVEYVQYMRAAGRP